MSSASKGRYQSRLFNFFQKQSRRFGEGFSRSLRQLQVATNWSLEAISKSIYLLLQKATDAAGNQLPAAAKSTTYLLNSSEEIVSDTAIARVLENVEIAIIKNQLTNTEYSVDKIQGVASQLCSQNLVLVIRDNEILDILTLPQQQALENKIISEVANYWSLWRLSQQKQETKENKILSKVGKLFKILAPVNTNTVKALSPAETQKIDNNKLLPNSRTLASLDTAVARFETNTLAPVSQIKIAVKNRGGKLIQVVREKLDIFLYGNQEAVVSNKVENNNDFEIQKNKISTLISAALNYFYREPKTPKIKQAPPKRYFPIKDRTPELKSKQSVDDWLSFDDLFGSESTQIKNNSQVNEKQFQLPNWRTLKLKEKAGLTEFHKSEKITATQTNQNTQVEAKPEWIETKAEIVGYQKHPLELLLSWIDGAMLRIEEAIVKFAGALKKILNQK